MEAPNFNSLTVNHLYSPLYRQLTNLLMELVSALEYLSMQ